MYHYYQIYPAFCILRTSVILKTYDLSERDAVMAGVRSSVVCHGACLDCLAVCTIAIVLPLGPSYTHSVGLLSYVYLFLPKNRLNIWYPPVIRSETQIPLTMSHKL